MRSICQRIELKNGRTWSVTREITEEAEIYKNLAMDLINKKIHNATYIRSIKRTPNYDGTQKITVSYDNEVRSIYTIHDR